MHLTKELRSEKQGVNRRFVINATFISMILLLSFAVKLAAEVDFSAGGRLAMEMYKGDWEFDRFREQADLILKKFSKREQELEDRISAVQERERELDMISVEIEKKLSELKAAEDNLRAEMKQAKEAAAEM